MSLSKLNARTLKLAYEMNAAHDAAALSAAADTVSAIGAPPDAPTTAPVPAPVPAPRRCNVGDASHVNPNAVHPVLMYRGVTLNGFDTPTRRDAATVSALPLTPDDAPALYAVAATLIGMTATINAADRIGSSPLDRLMFLTRAAERCIYTADRAVSRNGVRAFDGGYNGTAATRIRLSALSAVLAAETFPAPASALPSADVCDDLIVAHLASRKTATRPNGGYFAVNVGTINR